MMPKEQDRPMQLGPGPSSALRMRGATFRFGGPIEAEICREQLRWVGGHMGLNDCQRSTFAAIVRRTKKVDRLRKKGLLATILRYSLFNLSTKLPRNGTFSRKWFIRLQPLLRYAKFHGGKRGVSWSKHQRCPPDASRRRICFAIFTILFPNCVARSPFWVLRRVPRLSIPIFSQVF